jgi:hypothetical protein
VQKLEADMLQRLREQREANMQVIAMNEEQRLRDGSI